MAREIVFVDTETTGLDERWHEVWELAYLGSDGDAKETCLPLRNLENADPRALELNSFYERMPSELLEHGRYDVFVERRRILAAFVQQTVGVHLAGFNPSFDARFLTKACRDMGLTPAWHHRLIDLEVMYMYHARADEVKGTDAICEGLKIEKGDRHTARSDVLLARRVWEALWDARGGPYGV